MKGSTSTRTYFLPLLVALATTGGGNGQKLRGAPGAVPTAAGAAGHDESPKGPRGLVDVAIVAADGPSPNRRELSSSPCSGYFCDKYIDTMFILMTHNSNAAMGDTISPNQNHGEPRQFRDGIRGFGMDIYEHDDGTVYMKHGNYDPFEVDYAQRVAEIVAEMDAAGNEHEFVLVQFEDHLGTDGGVERACAAWGDRVITDFDSGARLGEYLTLGKRVLLTTTRRGHVRPDIGMHDTHDLIAENNYKWRDPAGSPDMGHRRGPTGGTRRYAKMMNYFCAPILGLGDIAASAVVNTEARMLHHARQFVKQPYAQGAISVMMVDFYDVGDVFAAQRAIRAGDLDGGYETEPCLGDGSQCVAGETCGNCCNAHQYWQSKGFTACGTDPCSSSGTRCFTLTTCSKCCRGANCPWYWFGFCTCN